MEPLTAAGLAIATVITTKAIEKTGEKVGETLWNQTGKFLVTLTKHSLYTVVALEKAPSQPLDYRKALSEVELAAAKHPEVNQAMQELAAAAKDDAKVNQAMQEWADIIVREALKSQSSTNQIFEKIINYAHGDVNIQNQTNNI
ncbi:MAG: hypothetical protein PUP92_18765 [Rhizonema sp. PD38]|nr:hypothetical protein [Rhizonema sp. PD38]